MSDPAKPIEIPIDLYQLLRISVKEKGETQVEFEGILIAFHVQEKPRGRRTLTFEFDEPLDIPLPR